MSCSPEDIEKKRLLAIERRNLRRQSSTVTGTGADSLNNRDSDNMKQKNDLSTLSPAPKKINRSSSEEMTSPAPSTSSTSTSPSSLSPTSPSYRFIHNQYRVKGSISMISDTRFQVDINYHQEFINYCQRFSSRYLDPQKKLWSFDVKEYDKFMQDLKSVPQVLVTGLPKYVYRIFVSKSANADIDINQEIDLSNIDSKLRQTLMSFQREGICFGIRKNGRCMIADDMGLGKTLQALAIAQYYQADWPLLIVAPASLT